MKKKRISARRARIHNEIPSRIADARNGIRHAQLANAASPTEVRVKTMTRMFFIKQKTAYEMVYSDWSSDVCSSDLDCSPAEISALGHGRNSRRWYASSS